MDYEEELGNKIKKDMEREGKWMMIGFGVFAVAVIVYMIFFA